MAHLGPPSRVVVTGALSQVGTELIFQLHEACGVEHIVGIDAGYPSTRRARLDTVESRYTHVLRRVPGFGRLLVPGFGVHPHQAVRRAAGDGPGLRERGGGRAWPAAS